MKLWSLLAVELADSHLPRRSDGRFEMLAELQAIKAQEHDKLQRLATVMGSVVKVGFFVCDRGPLGGLCQVALPRPTGLSLAIEVLRALPVHVGDSSFSELP